MISKYIIPLYILLLSLTLTSCEESGIIPNGNTVSGKIVYAFGTASNVKVIIGDKSAITDSEGRFTINNVSFPYNISVMYGDNADVFIELNISNPVICIGSEIGTSGTNKASITPELPIPPNSEQDLQMFFKPIDNLPIYSRTPGNTQSLDVYWDSKFNSIIGKLIILYTDGLSQTYYRFYQSDEIVLSNLQNTYVLPIDSNEFTFDPGERVVNGYVQSSLGNSFQAGTVLKFSDNSYFGYPQPFFGGNVNNNLSITLPDIPVEYNAFFYVENLFSGVNSRGLFKYIDGGNNNFMLYSPPMLVSPIQNDSISLFNTDFTWTQSEGNGIYRLSLTGSGAKQMNIYTSSANARVPDLTQFGFDPFEYGHNYYWRVMKLFDFSGMDELVSENYFQSNKYVSNTVNNTQQNFIYLY